MSQYLKESDLKKGEQTVMIKSITAIDEKYFSFLYKQYAVQVFRAALIYTRDEEVAKGIVQDVFLDLWKKRETGDIHESWQFFLLRCAKNKAIDRVRKLQLSYVYNEEFQNSTDHLNQFAEQDIFHDDLLNKVNSLVDQLPNQCREVYILKHENGLNNEQISLKLGIAIKTVKNHLHKAMSFLRTHLQEYR
ncbi:RNA polymerase sigma-70 factor [Pedobacter sp. PAMC26386]|nr:RNA polymerase sigma-70 factor [Pedobacter sp. PAMC26386]